MNHYSSIVDSFRDKINDNVDFILRKYKDENDKNLWNCICSAMDWLTVATRYIDAQREYSSNIDKMSIEVYTFISTIDIVEEAIQQLHRAIINKNTKPFENDNRIFNDTRLSKDDTEYFKHIRAAFGAHPVNLKDDIKRFASWPTNHVYTQYDLAVSLYSSEKNIPDVILGFTFEQLYQYLDSRIGYLNEVLTALDVQYEEFCSEIRSKEIERSDDIIKQLEILEREERLRFSNDYYHDTILKLRRFFRTQSSCLANDEAISNWHDKLFRMVDEIFNNLQNMKIEELKTDIFEGIFPQELQYAYQKFSDYLDGSDPIFYGKPQVISFINRYLYADDKMPLDELYLLANVCSYLYAQEEGFI